MTFFDHNSFILNCVPSKLHLFFANQQKLYIYVNMYASIYVIIYKIYNIYSYLEKIRPDTSVTLERSFSMARQIKTWL